MTEQRYSPWTDTQTPTHTFYAYVWTCHYIFICFRVNYFDKWVSVNLNKLILYFVVPATRKGLLWKLRKKWKHLQPNLPQPKWLQWRGAAWGHAGDTVGASLLLAHPLTMMRTPQDPKQHPPHLVGLSLSQRKKFCLWIDQISHLFYLQLPWSVLKRL